MLMQSPLRSGLKQIQNIPSAADTKYMQAMVYINIYIYGIFDINYGYIFKLQPYIKFLIKYNFHFIIFRSLK